MPGGCLYYCGQYFGACSAVVCCQRDLCGYSHNYIEHPADSTWESLMQKKYNYPVSPKLEEFLENGKEMSGTTPLGMQLRFRKYSKDVGFKTGDVIGFNSYLGEHAVRDGLRAIARKTTNAKVTHVGMVYVHPPTGEAFCLEAECSTNTFKTIEAFTGGLYTRHGMWAFGLMNRVETSAAELFHLRLKDPLNEEEAANAAAFMLARYIDDPPFDYESMFNAGADSLDKHGMEGTKDDFRKLFCSEFVAGTLKAAGRLPDSVNASEQTPSNVWDFDIWDLKEGVHPHNHLKFDGEFATIQPGCCLSAWTKFCLCICPCCCSRPDYSPEERRLLLAHGRLDPVTKQPTAQ